ncbi:MAG TPA: amidohydrolase [Nitrososphaerales archaeon]|nr:amidohydrolase [Nitrososphaerales archaeon]
MKPILISDCSIGSARKSILVMGGVIDEVYDGVPVPSPDWTVIEAAGGTILPGLIDTHCHPFELGSLKKELDLRGVGNIVGLRLRLAAAVRRTPKGDWIVGRGWDHEAFSDLRLPSMSDVDDLTPDNPIVLTRVCGHIALINSRALTLLGPGERRGPECDRDESGELTGILRESALEEVYAKVPRTVAGEAEALLAAEFEASRFGLTSLYAIVSPEGWREQLESLLTLESGGSLSLRYRVYVPNEAMGFVAEQKGKGRFESDSVCVKGVKLYTDGSLGARTAALREPYYDDPGNSGILRYSDEELAELVSRADQAGHQVIVHAIGDRAVEQAADALSTIVGGGNPRRHRVEHASLLPKDLRSKLVRLSIPVTVQPMFIVSDSWASRRLGDERVLDLYPLKSMAEEGLTASGSSDSPVETMSPILGMWAAMDRGGTNPPESLTMDEAVALYTDSARLNGGLPVQRVEAGMPADLTLLDSDVQGMHPALLRKVGVTLTMVGGHPVYSSGAVEA